MGNIIAITILIVVVIFCILIIRNLLSQNKQLESYINVQHFVIKDKVTIALRKMKEADINGAFEADDEVGSTFTDLKEIIEKLDKEISDEYKNIN